MTQRGVCHHILGKQDRRYTTSSSSAVKSVCFRGSEKIFALKLLLLNKAKDLRIYLFIKRSIYENSYNVLSRQHTSSSKFAHVNWCLDVFVHLCLHHEEKITENQLTVCRGVLFWLFILVLFVCQAPTCGGEQAPERAARKISQFWVHSRHDWLVLNKFCSDLGRHNDVTPFQPPNQRWFVCHGPA